MIYAVFFEDEPSRMDERPRHMPAHLAFLADNADRIEAAGPLLDTAGNEPAGGLWLVSADRPEDVRALVESDPFWPTGLRKSVRILAWKQVFADGQALIPMAG